MRRAKSNTSVSAVVKHALSLRAKDRVVLIEDIGDSLVDTPEALPLTEAQRKELARRRRVHARAVPATKSREDVRGKLESRR